MNKTIAGLAALTAAAGLSCARDAPVNEPDYMYNNTAGGVREDGSSEYVSVRANAETFELSIFRRTQDGRQSEFTYTRQEPADNISCNSESIRIRDENSLADDLFAVHLHDADCNSTVDSADVYMMQGARGAGPFLMRNQTWYRSEFGQMYDLTFSLSRADIDNTIREAFEQQGRTADLDSVIDGWHRLKAQ